MSLPQLMKRYHEKTGRPALINSIYSADFVEGLAAIVDKYEKETVSTSVDVAMEARKIRCDECVEKLENILTDLNG